MNDIIDLQKCFSCLVDAGFEAYDQSRMWSACQDFHGETLVIQRMNTFNYDKGRVENGIWVCLEVNMVCGGKIEAQYWYGKKFDRWEDALEHAKDIISQGEGWQPLIDFRNDPSSDLSKGRY